MIDAKAAGTRETLSSLIERQHLSELNVPNAVAIADISPSANQWQNFMRSMLFWSGSIALSFSLIFFVAANWQDIGKMAKFVLVEFAIVLAIFSYVKFNHNDTLRNASLVVCILFVGGLMALFGQTYQTGADPWQLFFNWAMVTIPWVLISRFSVIWLIWLGLINLSISLFYQTFGGFLDHAWALFIFNSIALIVWQIGALKLSWLDKLWAINLLGAVSGYFAMWIYFDALYDDKLLGISIWCAWAASTFYVYRFLLLNVFMLAGWCLSVVVAVNALMIRFLPNSFDAISFLLLAILTIGLGTYLAVWLKGLLKEVRS